MALKVARVFVQSWGAFSELCSVSVSHGVSIHEEYFYLVPSHGLAKSLGLFEPSVSISTTWQDYVKVERPR